VNYVERKSETVLGKAIGSLRSAFIDVGVFSFAITCLMLTSPLYMMQIYDRVLASRSEPTLLYLTLFAAAALGTLAALELIRSRILVRAGADWMSYSQTGVFSMILSSGANGQAIRDMDTLRTFLSGAGMLALLDAPWTPLFLALVYLLHPMLGHVALAGSLILFTLALVNEYSTRKPLAEAGGRLASSTNFAEMSARNAEVVRAMGMLPGLRLVWRKVHDQGLGLQLLASDRAGNIAAAAKFTRFFLQVATLGVGAYLVIAQEITAGVMIAASIIMGRALAPVESAIGSWRGFLLARSAYSRLSEGLDHAGEEADSMPLPAPKRPPNAENLFGIPLAPKNRLSPAYPSACRRVQPRYHGSQRCGKIFSGTLCWSVYGVLLWPGASGQRQYIRLAP